MNSKIEGLNLKQIFFVSSRLWISFIIVNTVLFLPLLIFKISDGLKIQINLEITIFFVIWALYGKRFDYRELKRFQTRFSLLFVISLIYFSYTSAVSGLYHLEPNFFNDYPFVLGNLSFLLEALNLSLWVYLAGGMAIFFLVILIHRGAQLTFTEGQFFSFKPQIGIAIITFGFIAFLMGSKLLKSNHYINKNFSSLTVELILNIQRSNESGENLKTFMAIDPKEVYDYSQYSVSDTPDVFFVFVESYGSVVYNQPELTVPYLEMVETMGESIISAGWSTASILSDAPVWGGGSWMSYTSTLFGISIEQQVEFDALKEKYSKLEYPNLGRYFSSMEYEYVWVVPIDRKLHEEDEASNQLFYGVDQWITFESLKYNGPLLGWGPSVPDQFTFGYIQEFIRKQQLPTFLVFLTQNLHYPWTPIPPLIDDWRQVGNLEIEDFELPEGQKQNVSWEEKYLQALNYTINSLQEFILSLEKEDSIIILIGDHQPPAVSGKDDGYETMIHIISKDTDLLATFYEYGFVDGLVLENQESNFQHEGLYSLFVRNFLSQYGDNPLIVPPYLPNGIQ